MNYVLLILGIGLLIYDGILAAKDKTTISQACQKLFPRGIDWGIGIGGWFALILAKAYWYPELDFALSVIWAGFWGHIWIANKERYKK